MTNEYVSKTSETSGIAVHLAGLLASDSVVTARASAFGFKLCSYTLFGEACARKPISQNI